MSTLRHPNSQRLGIGTWVMGWVEGTPLRESWPPPPQVQSLVTKGHDFLKLKKMGLKKPCSASFFTRLWWDSRGNSPNLVCNNYRCLPPEIPPLHVWTLLECRTHTVQSWVIDPPSDSMHPSFKQWIWFPQSKKVHGSSAKKVVQQCLPIVLIDFLTLH